MDRIDPKRFPEICRREGMRPTRGVYLEAKPDRCGCVKGISLVARHGFDAAKDMNRIDRGKSLNDDVYAAEVLDLTVEYAAGLEHGWQGVPGNVPGGEYRDGHDDGAAAWRACADAGLCEYNPIYFWL